MADADQIEPSFTELIEHIQRSRGMDFRGYKKTSLRRRIQRRMQEVGVVSYPAYQAFLEVHPQEYVELLNTVLINVTSFFRDSDAWEAIREEAIPHALTRHEGQIRVWSAGCASGEEPYSLAMLLMEALGPEAFARRVKIYATDLDEGALHTARLATYSPRDVEGIPAELLNRHFTRERDNFVVSRDLRKAIIFGRHNLVADAPISRISLLTCRNLLIYLETETQEQVLPRLHFALTDDGLLFLGKAETQLARSRLFQPLNLKHRIFRKVVQEWRRNPGVPSFLAPASASADASQSRVSAHGQLAEILIDASPVAYVLVNEEGALAFANLAARRILDVSAEDLGRPFQDLAAAYRPIELRGRIEEAHALGRSIRLEHQPLPRPLGEAQQVTVEIRPLPNPDGTQASTLISFTDTSRLFAMERELEAAQETLSTTVEELQSANEELETTNEELQSTNEELETTNEELQSTNEELETMNEELRSANDELELVNDALRLQEEHSNEYHRRTDALLSGIEAGLVALDRQLRVENWNRWNEITWGLRPEEVQGHDFLALDIGLPVQQLEEDLKRVLAGETPLAEVTLEARDRRGRPMFCRIRVSPISRDARTHEGVILVVEDATEARREQEYTRYLGRVLGQALNEVYFLDPDTLRFVLINRGAEQKLGYSIEQLRMIPITALMPGILPAAVHSLLAPLLNGEKPEIVFETVMRTRDGREYPAELCMQHMPQEQPPILVAMVHDISDRRRLEQGDGHPADAPR